MKKNLSKFKNKSLKKLKILNLILFLENIFGIKVKGIRYYCHEISSLKMFKKKNLF